MKWRYGAGSGLRAQGSGAAMAVMGYTFFFLSFSYDSFFNGDKDFGGELCHLAGSPGGGGDYQGPVILQLERIQYD